MALPTIDVNVPDMLRMVLGEGEPTAAPRLHLVRLVRVAAGWSGLELAAPFWRCYLPLEAGGWLQLGPERHPLVPGRSHLIPPETPARAGLQRPFVKLFCHFDRAPDQQRVRPGLYAAPAPALPPWDPELWRAMDRVRLGLLALAACSAALASLPADACQARPRCSPAIAAIVDRLDRQPGPAPDNSALAASIGMHPTSFVRRFRNEVGLPPQRYARQRCLEEAARLLVAGTRSIEEIAAALGFADRHHFSRAFARRWRCPPATFRRRNRE